MKTVRILSPYVPYPTDEGAFHLILNQTIYFASQFDRVEVLCWKNSPEEFQIKVAAIQKRFGLANVEWRDLSPFVKNKSRHLRLVDALASRWASPELHYYPMLTSLPNLTEANLEIFHYSFCIPWLEQWPKRARKRVCVLHNIESDIFRAKIKDERRFLARTYHESTLKKLIRHEKSLAAHVDELWCLSQIDATDFSKVANTAKIVVTPPNYDGWSNLEPRFEEQKPITIGFIGGMDFGPNHDSAEFILTQIAPLLANDRNKIRLIIAGKNPPESLREIAKRFDFVEMPGFVKDIETFWPELDAFLIPHITGSGVRTKLLEALARRVPTLTNAAGFSRIDPVLSEINYLHVSDNPKDWVEWISNGQLRRERKEALSIPFPEKLRGRWTLRNVEVQ